MIIELSEDLLQKKDYSEKDFRIDIATVLYQKQIVTLARLARGCGLTRLAFQKELAKRNIPINFTIDDLNIDLQTLQSMPPL